MKNEATVRAGIQVTRILYGALVASSFLYLFVLFMVSSGVVSGVASDPASTATPSADFTLVIAFAVVAVGVAAASFVVPRRLVEANLSAYRPDIETTRVPAPGGLYADATEERRVFSDPWGTRHDLRTKRFAPMILSWALSEAIAVFGLVLGFMGHELGAVLPFFVLCWALLIVHAPRFAIYDREAEQRYGATFPAA